MKVKKLFIAGLLLGSILSSGCAENPADKVPSANVNTPAAQPAEATETPVAGQAATPADPAAGVSYLFPADAEVAWVGSKVTGSHDGGFKKVEGRVTLPGEDMEQAVVDITIDTTSIYSDDEKLTSHLKSEDFFAVASYPTASFKSTGIKKTDQNYEITGDLTLHGVTKSVSFPADIMLEGDKLKTKAEFAINRKDFEIVYAGKPDDLIRDEVVIKFDITAAKDA